jgi:hypothetical protein
MKRTVTGILAGLLAGATLGFLGAGPAAAGGSFCAGTDANAPDGRMRLNGGEWAGGGSYPNVGLNADLGAGQSALYDMQWRNRGGDNLTIRLKLGTQMRAGFGVRFFLAGENVTTHLRDGKALRFPHVAPGKRTGILTVRLTNKSGTTNEAQIFVQGSYGGNPIPTHCDELAAEANF